MIKKYILVLAFILPSACAPLPSAQASPSPMLELGTSTSAPQVFLPPPGLVPPKTAPPPVAQPPAVPSSTPPAPAPTLPSEARILSITGKDQALPLSCEARSAADWAAFFGIPIDELAFQAALPRSDDPDLGFVGDSGGVWGQIPPHPYGVHAAPVAALLRSNDLPAEARRHMTLTELKAEIAAGRPVIAWVVGHVTEGTPQTYITRAGRGVTVAAKEHTVIVTGYSPEVIYVLDGSWVYARATRHFVNSWGVLGNMAVVLRP